MAGSNDFTGQNIQDTYQRVLQLSSSGELADGTGSLVPLLTVTASHAISASHEITFELSSSHAQTADQVGSFTATAIGQTYDTVTSPGQGQLLFTELDNGTDTVNIVNLTGTGTPSFGTLTLGTAPSAIIEDGSGASIFFPDGASTDTSVHLKVKTDTGVSPGIFLGGRNEDIITFLDQEKSLVAKIDQNGVYHGTVLNGAVTNASNTFSANQILNNDKELQGKNTAGQTRHLISLQSTNVVNVGATGQPTSLRSSGIISTTGSLIISGTNATSSFLEVKGHITASGNISASGTVITTGNVEVGTDLFIGRAISASHATATHIIGGKTKFTGHITASGNISASGNLITSKSLNFGADAATISANGSLTIRGQSPTSNDFIFLSQDNIDLKINGLEYVSVEDNQILLNANNQDVDVKIAHDDGINAFHSDAATNRVKLRNHVTIGNNSAPNADGSTSPFTTSTALLVSGSQTNIGHLSVSGHITGSNISASGHISASGTIVGSNTIKLANTKRFQGAQSNQDNAGNWNHSDNEGENKDDQYDNDTGLTNITSGVSTISTTIAAKANKYIVPIATTASKWTGILTHTNNLDLSIGLWRVRPVDNNNIALPLHEITGEVTLEGKGNAKMRTFSVDIHVDSGSLSPGDLIVPLLRRESGTSSGVAHFQSTLLFYTEV